jgi:hypothetical protein
MTAGIARVMQRPEPMCILEIVRAVRLRIVASCGARARARLDDELRFHLAMREESYKAAGASTEEAGARRAPVRQPPRVEGGVPRRVELYQLESSDRTRYALRVLLKAPASRPWPCCRSRSASAATPRCSAS